MPFLLFYLITFLLFNHYLAELSLQHSRVKYRHLVVHNGKGKQMTVAALTVTGKRTDTVRVGECARFSAHFTSQFGACQLTTQRTVDAGNGQMVVQHAVNGLVVIAISQNGGQRSGRNLVVNAESAGVMYHVRGVSYAQFIAHEATQIGQSGGDRFAVRVDMMADGVEQSRGLCVGTVLPHAVDDAVDGTVETEDAMRTAWRSAPNHLLIVNRNARCSERMLEGFLNTFGSPVEQTISGKRQIPWIPVDFALHRGCQNKVDDEPTVKFSDAFTAQGTGKHVEVGLVHLRIQAGLEADVTLESAVFRDAFCVKRCGIKIFCAKQMQPRYAAQELQTRG